MGFSSLHHCNAFEQNVCACLHPDRARTKEKRERRREMKETVLHPTTAIGSTEYKL